MARTSHHIRGAALALALATSLSACDNAEAPATPADAVEASATGIEALFASALERPDAQSGAGFDGERLKAYFSEWGTLTYASEGVDPDTGAYRLGDVAFQLTGEDAGLIVTASEILFWNFDLDAIDARLEGQRLDETLRIFDRIEIAGLLFDANDYLGATRDMFPEEVQEAMEYAELEQSIKLEAGRMVLGGLTLHPWTYSPAEDASEGARAIGLISAMARNFSMDTVLLLDSVMTQSQTDSTFTSVGTTTYPRSLTYGYDRGDLKGAIQTDATTDLSFKFDDPEMSDGFPGFQMTGRVGKSAMSDLRLGQALEWGEQGVLPPISELTEFSLGTYLMEDTSFALDGSPVFEMAKLEASADQFSWFFPEEINLAYEGVSIDLSQFLTTIENIIDASGEPVDEPTPRQIADMLERSGLATLKADGRLNLSWNRETGKTTGESYNATENFFTEDWRFDIGLPSFAEIVPHFGEDGRSPDGDALSDLLEERFSFAGAHWALTDSGGLDAIAKMVIEVAKANPDGNPMLAGFADAEPEAVRAFGAGSLAVGSGEAGKMVPQASDWLMRLSDFITQGGKIELRMAPPVPVTAETAMGESGGMSQPDPAELVALYGVTVTHTPPPGSETP